MRTGCWLALALLSVAGGCGTGGAREEATLGAAQQGILGGERASYADLRGTVALVEADSGFPYCSGTLVAPDVVITAAHCAIVFDPDTGKITGLRDAASVLVVAGETALNLADSSNAYPLSRISVHPNYLQGPPEDPAEQFGGLHDIALLALTDEVDELTPVPVLDSAKARELLTLGSELVIEGYGTSDQDGTQGGGILREAEVPLVRVGQDEFIAGQSGTPDTCPGDSGGPVYVERDGVLALVGVTSRGLLSSSKPCGEGGIYTLVPAHLSFLNQFSPTPIASIQGDVTGEGSDDPGDGDAGDGDQGDGDRGDGDGDGDRGDESGAEPETSTSTDAIQAAGPTTGGCQSYPFAAAPLGGPGAAMFLGLVAFVLRRRGGA